MAIRGECHYGGDEAIDRWEKNRVHHVCGLRCQVTNLSLPPVVPARLAPPTAAANRFFERRSSLKIRRSGLPNTPRTIARARKPASEYLLMLDQSWGKGFGRAGLSRRIAY
jgi:hypothetical protein